jgi:FkbM family methyltransferase
MVKKTIKTFLARRGREIRPLHQPEAFFGSVPLAMILDIGANIGQFAIQMRRAQPNAIIHSFEPIPDVARQLRDNFATDSKFFAHEIAVSDSRGEAAFAVNEFSASSSLLPVATEHKKLFPFAQETMPITVPVTTLNEWAKVHSLQRPLLLKLDVQGNELAVLRGAGDVLSAAEYLLTEVNFFKFYEGQPTFSELYRRVNGFGFEFIDFFSAVVHAEEKRSAYGDALFVKSPALTMM